jgi:hypothetical protein
MLELAYGKSDRSICYSCNGLNPPLVPKEAIYIYIYIKLDTNSCFAKLRAISNLFSFFIHPVERLLINTSILIIVSHFLKEDIDRRLCQDLGGRFKVTVIGITFHCVDTTWWPDGKMLHFSTRLQLSALLNKACMRIVDELTWNQFQFRRWTLTCMQ